MTLAELIFLAAPRQVCEVHDWTVDVMWLRIEPFVFSLVSQFLAATFIRVESNNKRAYLEIEYYDIYIWKYI